VRSWTDRSGTFTVEAAYISLVEGKVHLLKLNGVTIKVPLEKLNDEAVRFLKTQPGNHGLVESKQVALPPQTPLNRPPSNVNIDAGSYTYNGFNWREWLVKAGVASGDASTYAVKLCEQRMDSSILQDLDRDSLRTMQITEGDIIRIRKAASLPAITADVRKKYSTNEKLAQERNLQNLTGKMASLSSIGSNQISEDEAYARKLQEEENRNTRGSGNQVDSNAIFAAGNLLKQSNSSTKRSNTIASSPSARSTFETGPIRNSSIIPPSNDPWNNFTSSDNQNQKWKDKQDETQKTLAMAKQAIESANEKAKQAALIEEQSRAKKAELALQQAQETAQKALMMQKMAEQKLQKAKEEQEMALKIAAMNRPLAAPLIPVPQQFGQSPGFFNPSIQNQRSGQGFNSPLQNQMSGGSQGFSNPQPLQNQMSGGGKGFNTSLQNQMSGGGQGFNNTMQPLQNQMSGGGLGGFNNTIQPLQTQMSGGGLGGFNNTIQPLQNQMSGQYNMNNQMQMNNNGSTFQQGIPTLVSNQGVQRPNWTSASNL
jgi:hypothetical protein